jgi:phosphatidylserine decarboxylase
MLQRDDINFVLTNRVPRRLATRVVGWASRLELPIVRDALIALFEAFAGDLRLHEAKKKRFASLHDCFVRELKDGVRPLDPDPAILVSPCDGIVGAFGRIHEAQLLQAKGSPYTLDELVGDPATAARYRGGSYVTLRLTANMYHRFHAPCDCRFREVRYFSGETWNVNAPALQRIARLYCQNERVVIDAAVDGGHDRIALVAVAAILVASIQLACHDGPLNLSYHGPTVIGCDAAYRKGEELGYFHHGSTIIVLATAGLGVCGHVRSGAVVRVGEPLLRRATASSSDS